MTTVAIDKSLIAHLLRRAGFGATFQEIEKYAEMGYEETVDHLLHPERTPDIEEDLLERYYIDWKESRNIEGALTESVYRMNAYAGVRPLQEKIALFWHGVFATGLAKVLHEKTILNQIDLFRQHGLGSYRDLLVGIAKDPAMIFWLDNNENHHGEPNENWGRELLELFSLGVGNYSEIDIKHASRAFTGWTFAQSPPLYPHGYYPADFLFVEDDHDNGDKEFLGHKGNLDGGDIIDIIVKQPACAAFISRHLYNFFVADEPQVPAWKDTPPIDPAAIKELEDEYFRSNYNITAMLKVLFKSDWFKAATFAKVKSPAETVVGTLKLVGDFKFPRPGLDMMTMNIRFMGQDLLNPPTVEGWHTGHEWIDSGTLVERINFAADYLGQTNLEGNQTMISNLMGQGASLSPQQFVEGCIDQVGCLNITVDTRGELLAHVQREGDLSHGTDAERAEFVRRSGEMFQMLAATSEFQFE